MATWRLSRLQQRILHWVAVDHQRTKGMSVSSHEDLIKALREDKSNIGRSLRILERRGWIIIGRSPGGKAQHVTLTAEGIQRASEITKKLCIRHYFFKHNRLKKALFPFYDCPLPRR